ncbi:sensor histidine kinase [Desulfogranum mediterraneum]|uniref:sensor histidine kinase n=1 Tax=Desulfogranum mediterraneum TaxID=160661 RepID=UPI00041981A2|nr:ATP-binding protein [Desulfogranum mediterraneum]
MVDIWARSCELLEDPVFIVSTEGTIVNVNQAALAACRKRRQEVLGQAICTIIHGGKLPHIACPLEQFLQTFSSRVMETHLPGLYGDYLLTISTTSHREDDRRLLLLLARELSREEARKVEYHRTAQLAAIGELAAGVAHEVNNPINGIINLAQLMLDDARSDEDRDLLTRVVSEGERIAAITHKLLCFAKEDQEEKVILTLKESIDDCLNLMRHQLHKDGIEVVCEYLDHPCQVRANSNVLQQVFFNLLSNSRYALNQRYQQHDPKKRILIRCQQLPFENNNGVYARILIKDWGCGIPQGLLDRVCDPFFTTKPCGEGTGLGLSISHGIVKEHGGTMKIESVLHEYTAITIDLPAVVPPSES